MNRKPTNEWMTPLWLITEIRRFLEVIELDPCSTHKANATVRAREFWTKEENAFEQCWFGYRTLYMNPPYLPSELAGRFIDRAIETYEAPGTSLEKALILTRASPDTKWFNKLAKHGTVAFSQGRVSFVNEAGDMEDNPGSGHILTYLGAMPMGFAHWVENMKIPEGKGYPRGWVVPNQDLLY